MYTDQSYVTAIPTINTAAAAGTTTTAAAIWDMSSFRDPAIGTPMYLTLNLATAYATTAPTDILNSTIAVDLYQSDSSTMAGEEFVTTVMSIKGSTLTAAASSVTVPLPPAIWAPGSPNALTLGPTVGWQGGQIKRYWRFKFRASNTSSVAFSTSGSGYLLLVLNPASSAFTFYPDAISTLPNPV